MEQIALIGDTHFSRKADNPTIKKHIKEGQIAFFDFVSEELKRRNVKTILFTGDVHDSRNSINVEALVQTKNLLKDKLKEFDKHIILGNHDLYYENSYDVSSLELFDGIPNLTLYLKNVAKVKLLKKDWFLVPWLIQATQGPFAEYLKKLATKPEIKTNSVIFGHFEMLGVDMEGGQRSVIGMDPNLFANACNLTISGHYHGQSETKKSGSTILYLGSPYPLTFANSDQKHGIWLINENLEYEFIENTISPDFKTIKDTDDLENIPDLKNSFVRFYIDRNKSPEEFLDAKIKIEAKKPLVLNTIPYKDAIVENRIDSQQKEANQVLHMDMLNLTDLYLNKNEEELPELKFYKDPKEEIMKRMRAFTEETR